MPATVMRPMLLAGALTALSSVPAIAQVLVDQCAVAVPPKCTLQMNLGKYFVFSDAAGNPAACSRLGAGAVPNTLTAYFAGTVKGTVQITSGDAAGRLAISFDITGAAAACSAGAAPTADNVCGFSINTGTNCTSATEHFFKDVDPWKAQKWGNAYEAKGAATVKTGNDTLADTSGKLIIVHDKDGVRVGCAELKKKANTDTFLTAESFTKYLGYAGTLAVQGQVKVGFATGTEMSYTLSGADTGCDDVLVSDKPNSCGVHIHAGTTCTAAAEGHFYDTAVITTDPWTDIRYVNKGKAAAGSISSDMSKYVVMAGVTVNDIVGKTIVFADSAGGSGGFSSCGVFGELKDGSVRATISNLTTYPNIHYLEGTVTVRASASVVDALEVSFDLSAPKTGLEGFCTHFSEPGGGKCTFSIHKGATCDSVGANYFLPPVTVDPWMRTTYVMDRWAFAKAVPVKTDTACADNKGKALVVHDSAGVKVACSLLVESASQDGRCLLRAEAFDTIPGYTGSLVVTGRVEVSFADSTKKEMVLDYALQGMDTLCDGIKIGATNYCGVHIHTGTTCDDPKGHYFGGDVDVWQNITYVTKGYRAVTVGTAFANREAYSGATTTTATTTATATMSTTTTITGGTVTATTTLAMVTTVTTTVKPEDMKVKVGKTVGKAGFTASYTDDAQKKIMVDFDSLSEVTLGGTKIVTHFSDMNLPAAIADFKEGTGSLEDVGVKANKLPYSYGNDTFDMIGLSYFLRVDTYVMGQDGKANTADGQVDVKTGDVKWNIALKDWNFCDGLCAEVGAFVDVKVFVSGTFDDAAFATGRGATRSNNVALDHVKGLMLVPSKKVQVDGVWKDMPADFPLVEVESKKVTMTVRFPKFNKEAIYETLIVGMIPPPDNTPPAGNGSGIGAGGIIAIILIILVVLGGFIWFCRPKAEVREYSEQVEMRA